MNKKISLLIILCLFAISCGKKEDPVYKEPENNAKIFDTKFKVVL